MQNILLIRVISRLSSFDAALIVFWVTAFFLFGWYDLVLIAWVIGVFSIFARLVDPGVASVAFQFFHGLFGLDLRGFEVILYGLAEGMGYIFVDVEIEMVKLILSEIGATEGNFKGETVDNI